MKNNILISIVLPIYGVENYIERCIESLIPLDNDVELIFVDDMSPDNSINKVIFLSSKIKNYKILYNSKNIGTFSSRKKGVLNANGKYIFFVDPDDEISPNAISEIRKVAEIHNPDIILTLVDYRPEKRFLNKKIKNQEILTETEILSSLFIAHKSSLFGNPGKIYKKDILLQAYIDCGEFIQNMRYGEDKLLFLLSANRAKLMIPINQYLYVYHKNPDSISSVDDFIPSVNKIEQLTRIIILIDALKFNNVFGTWQSLKAAEVIKENLMNDIRIISLNTLHYERQSIVKFTRLVIYFFYKKILPWSKN